MKPNICPKCGNHSVSDRWCAGRKLQYYCYDEDCNWKADPRTPSRRHISNTKEIGINGFSGWDFIVYDKYGHEIIISRSYDSKATAVKDMNEDLEQGQRDKDGGPYTAVLFNTPSTITLKGEMFTHR